MDAGRRLHSSGGWAGLLRPHSLLCTQGLPERGGNTDRGKGQQKDARTKGQCSSCFCSLRPWSLDSVSSRALFSATHSSKFSFSLKLVSEPSSQQMPACVLAGSDWTIGHTLSGFRTDDREDWAIGSRRRKSHACFPRVIPTKGEGTGLSTHQLPICP